VAILSGGAEITCDPRAGRPGAAHDAPLAADPGGTAQRLLRPGPGRRVPRRLAALTDAEVAAFGNAGRRVPARSR